MNNNQQVILSNHQTKGSPKSPATTQPLYLKSNILYKMFSKYGDCVHEIKRRLLLGRKVTTDLDSILKSRDITLPTKVHLVKAMVFPVVMYECLRVGL